MTPHSTGYAKTTHPIIRRLLRAPFIALCSHWVFQSMTYMGATERWFKVLIDAALTVFAFVLLLQWLPPVASIVLAWFVAHTINLLANGHVWGVLKHYGYTNWTYERFQDYCTQFTDAARREPSIMQTMVYGSVSRQAWSPRSDLDVRLVRRSGIINGFRASWFLLRQRSRALIAGFPLDAYLVDHLSALECMDGSEQPRIFQAVMAPPATRIHASEPTTREGARRWVVVLSEIMLFVACLLPGMIFSARGLQEPWTTFRFARAQMSLESGHILPYTTAASGYRSEHIGVELINSALIKATTWSLESLALVPIGALLIAIAYYGLSHTVTQSRRWASLITLFASWYYPALYSQFGTQTYAWVHVQFLGFLLLLWMWLQARTLIVSLALIGLFITTFLSYHTTPLWMIMALFGAVAGIKLHERSRGLTSSRLLWGLPLACTVFYASFDSVVVTDGMSRMTSGGTINALVQAIARKIMAPFLDRAPTTLDPFEIAPVNPRMATWMTLVVLVVLATPVLVWTVARCRHAWSKRSLAMVVPDVQAIFVWTIILVAVGHAGIYMAYGSLSFRVIPLAFPIILPLLWRTVQMRQVLGVLSGVLVGAAVLGFASYAPTVQSDTLAGETGLASKLLPANSHLLADANLYGSLLLQSSHDQKVLDLTWIDSENYQSVMHGVIPTGTEYVAMSTQLKPLTALNWQYFMPWPITDLGAASATMDQIYASDSLILLQPAGQALSTYRPAPMLDKPHGSPLIAALTLWGALIGLIGLPGLAWACLAQRGTLFGRTADIRTMVGLAVALGIAHVTLMGYAVNYSRLGSDWLLPLVIAVPMVGMGALIMLRRQRLHIAAPWVRYGGTLVVISVLWAGLSTVIATHRSNTAAAVSEFFLTQDQPNVLTLNIANGTLDNQTMTLAITVDDQVVEQRTLHIPAGTIQAHGWSIQPEMEGKAAAMILFNQGQPFRTVRLAKLKGGL